MLYYIYNLYYIYILYISYYIYTYVYIHPHIFVSTIVSVVALLVPPLKRKAMARPPSESPASAKHRAATTRRAMPLRPWMQAEIPMAHGNPAAKNDESPVDKNHGNNSEKIYNVFSVSNESVNIWDKSDKFNHWWREKTLQFSAEFWEPCGPSWLWIGAVFDSNGLELKKTSCANLFSSGTQKILAACISCQVLY